MKIKRRCSCCGKKLIININKNKTYSKANYFGKFKINGKCFEYWECDECYNKEDLFLGKKVG